MRLSIRLAAAALAAMTLGVPAVADARKKKQKPPSKTVITKQLRNAYCKGERAMNGNVISTVDVTMRSLRIARPRVGRSWLDGTPANRRTLVFPVSASYLCDYTATELANEGWEPDDKSIRGEYIFFRNEFGRWTHRYKRATEKVIERP